MKRCTIAALMAVLVVLAAARGQSHDREPPVTFARHIAPIVFNACAPCHRPEGGAPFPLLTYEDVAKRGRQIAAATRRGIMPPWHAEVGSYPFRDERRLTPEQIASIQRWVEQDMPKGDLRTLPPVPSFPSGWQLGPPDIVVRLPAGYRVPAEGPDVYRNFAIPLDLDRDTWIRAIELRPSARPVVHHVLFFADASGAARRADDADREPGYTGMSPALRSAPLGGWATGQQSHFYPDGIALPLAKGADLVLQYHFHPNGRAEVEQSTIGLYFADKAPARTLTSIQLPPFFGYFAGIDIPPGARDFRVRDSFVLPIDVEGVAVGAHAHYLGREMTMMATLPDGARKTLLRISRWDFAWQDRYVFQHLVPLPKGTRLDVDVAWDNSADNPDNPSDPPVRVQWGEGSTDEMGSVSLQVLPRQQSDLATLQRAIRQHRRSTAWGRFLTVVGDLP